MLLLTPGSVRHHTFRGSNLASRTHESEASSTSFASVTAPERSKGRGPLPVDFDKHASWDVTSPVSDRPVIADATTVVTSAAAADTRA